MHAEPRCEVDRTHETQGSDGVCRVPDDSIDHYAPAEGGTRQVRNLTLGSGSVGLSVKNSHHCHWLIAIMKPYSERRVTNALQSRWRANQIGTRDYTQSVRLASLGDHCIRLQTDAF